MKFTEAMEKGLDICNDYFNAYGLPMLLEKFPEYLEQITVGLMGEGSDCLGYDDEVSRDHDWGPGFGLFLSDELYEKIGDKLQQAYDSLPEEFQGFRRVNTFQANRRHGVIKSSAFYRNLCGTDIYEQIDWRQVSDASLRAAVSGAVFMEGDGSFSAFQKKLKKGYPEEIRFLKLAEDVAKISQTGQYNYGRLLKRGDCISAGIMLTQCMVQLMYCLHHIHNIYPPHDKWLYRSTMLLPEGSELGELLQRMQQLFSIQDLAEAQKVSSQLMEHVGEYMASLLYSKDVISDIDSYLGNHVNELLMKAGFAKLSDKELVRKIAKIEFEAFDKVKNEGGRAYCQNDWPTFSVMRKSQYLTWNRTMLLQYLYDFTREFELGHNLITEKYGRMMESTAPEQYDQLKQHFPEISQQKKAIIEQIVGLQMEMVEELSKEYPKVVGNARNLHTAEDNAFDTSYETYLRGEISTYSDKMLQLYAGYVIDFVGTGRNIAKETMTNTAKLYGYASLEEFEKGIK